MRLRSLATVTFLALAGCELLPFTPTSSASLAGDVIVTGPAGYCVDPSASSPANGFAVLAPCITLGGDQPAPEIVGVVTVQVGPEGTAAVTGDEIALRDFLLTPAGKRLLSTSGDHSGLRILTTQAFNDQVMVHFTDNSPSVIAGLQAEEWRGFVDVNGRLVTVAVRGLEIAPLGDGPGAGLLKLVMAGIGSEVPPVLPITGL